VKSSVEGIAVEVFGLSILLRSGGDLLRVLKMGTVILDWIMGTQNLYPITTQGILIYISEMLILQSRAKKGEKNGNYYTCKHFNSPTGLCGAYADRPAMCSDYPQYGDPDKKCTYKDLWLRMIILVDTREQLP